MFIHLKKIIVSIFVLIIVSCSLFDTPTDIVDNFSIVPSEYFGLNLKGIVQFSDKVSNLEWSSTSGQLVFDGKSNQDTLIADTVSIYYNRVPMVTKYISTTDTAGNSSIDTVVVMREKDTIFIRFIYENVIKTYQKVITLKNFKPLIDSFAVENGNFIEYNNKHYAAFLIGSGVAKIKTYAKDMLGDSVKVYWSSKSGLLASKELNSYIPFEFKIPSSMTSDTLYVRVTNSYGASTVDSIIVSMYKERGAVWVLDETPNLYKFSSTGYIINKIDSIYPKEIEFYDKNNELYVLTDDSLRAFYTDGTPSNYDATELVGYNGESHLYKLDGEIYLTIYALNKTSVFQLINNKFTARFSYNGKLNQLSKCFNYYFGIKDEVDSNYLVMFRGDSLLSRHRGFLEVNKIDVDCNNSRLYVSDKGVNKIFAYDFENDTIVATISGFSSPVDFAINPVSSQLFFLDATSSFFSLTSVNSSLNISGYLAKDALALEKPWSLKINPLDDGDGIGNVWICDTHNNRVLKINSSALILTSITGFFHFPRELAINRGL